MDSSSILIMLGLTAGALNMSSSVPQLIANLRDPLLARAQSPGRNFLQALANFGWAVWGIGMEAIEVVIFASAGFAMASVLLVQVMKAKSIENRTGGRSTHIH